MYWLACGAMLATGIYMHIVHNVTSYAVHPHLSNTYLSEHWVDPYCTCTMTRAINHIRNLAPMLA